MLREYIAEPRYVTDETDTIFSLLADRAQADPDSLIAQWQDPSARAWHDVTAGQMLARVRAVAKGLMALGVKPGTMVLIYSATSYEWGVVDFACAAIGAVSVPVYETDSARQAGVIIDATRPLIAFAGDEAHVRTLESLDDGGADKADVCRYVFNLAEGGLDAVVGFGHGVSDDQLDKAIARVKADDMATIVYTSGSTGTPKGAMLSHRNFTHIVKNGYEILPDMLYEDNRLMLFLPLAHCFARYIQYVAVGGHGVVGYLPGADHLLADLRSFKPTYLLGVPRVFEKVYNAASQKAGAGLKGRLFARAYAHFVRWSKDGQDTGRHSFKERLAHAFYMETVGSSIRSALGPNLKYLACGGAPLNADLAHFFNGMDGITFIQGYGMTETAAPMLVNWQDDNKVGSVGKPGPGMGVRMADDGELQLTGPNVFLGYYRQSELTAATMTDDGWIKSGDLGTIDDDGFVMITGRKKDIIITAGGKNVSPAPLEDIISTCPIVDHAVVVGDGRPFIAALIELEEEMTRSWLASQGLDAEMPMEEIAANDAVRAYVQQYVDQANANVSRAESVRKFVILTEAFSQEAGTLTPSLKVVRPKVLARYAQIIDEQLYAPKAGSARPLPATVKILDRTAETMRQASDNMSAAYEQAKANVASNVASVRANVSDSLASVSERMGGGETDADEDPADNGNDNDNDDNDKES